MPYCNFCGKQCTTAPGLDRHIARTPACKKASGENFGQYATSIWEDVPEKPDNAEPLPAEDLPDLPEFHLEEDIEMAEGMFNDEPINLLPVPPLPPQVEPLPHPQPEHGTVEVPNNEEGTDEGGRYIENMAEEYMAGATWGDCKPLFESLDEEQKRVGGNRWAPFADEDEWQLAEWLIRNVGQKQTDSFLKLSIVSFSLFELSA